MPFDRPARPALHVVTSTDRRGAQVFGVDLSESLEARGRASRTVALVDGTGESRLDIDVLGPRRFSSRTLRRLRADARHATAVVAHGSSTLPALVASSAGLRVPFVYRSIGDPSHWSATWGRQARVRLYLSRARAVVALTSGAADRLVHRYGVPPDRVHVIPQGVPADRFPPVDDERRASARRTLDVDQDVPVVVFVGALTPEKRVTDAIDALASLPDAQLLIAGDGPDRLELTRRAADVAPGRVRFLGAVRDPSVVFRAADVCVLPSATEGLPSVLIEAGLTGLPVVATDVGWVREIVVDGDTGGLVAAGDVHALTAALGELLHQPGDVGARARARCLDRFEMTPVAAQWDQLLTDVAAR